YHGKPYKGGSKKAPTCWDCHSVHAVKAQKDNGDAVSKDSAKKMCVKCHEDCDETFTDYSPMIHDRRRILSENPVVKLKDRVFTWIRINITDKVSGDLIGPVQEFLNTKYKEYLIERDKAVEVPTRTD
ncbi:MAG: hypothetical protein HY779_00700, partial [Rubrobacteridae bacterium]|nr:hypothetical protein [Rubrobacteridae bacterium]